MKISIVIPCHDAAPYLGQTIGSVLEQSRQPHEILVLDDRSTDASFDIALRFAGEVSPLVRVFQVECGNGSATRNLGALEASGDALMFLDADDVLGPDALKALSAALATQPDGIAACQWLRLEQHGGRWVERPASCATRATGQDALSAWLVGWYYPPCAVLWSRRAFERAGRWDELTVANQDGDIMMRALAEGVPLVETSSAHAYYRRRPEGESSVSARRLTRDGLASRIRTIEKIAGRLEQDGRVGGYREPLAGALHRVLDDAQGRFPDLTGQAHGLIARYGPSIAARLRRLVFPQALPDRPAGGSGQEVQAGLEGARRGLEPRGAVHGRPLRLSARPLVTAILPTYNRAHLLRRAIDSALAQTFGDFELLVADDGSTDGTSDLVLSYPDPRIRYLRQPANAGVSAARNRGLRESRGDFIAFLDSDDEWVPAKLAQQVERFRTLPARIGLLYGGVANTDDAGREWRVEPSERGDVYERLLLTNPIHGTSGVMIRRTVVAAVGLFDEAMPAIEDYDYWIRLARFFEIDFIDAPLIRYHDPGAGVRKSLDVPANIDARWYLYRKHAAEMRRAGVAHLFLRETVRRTLLSRSPDKRVARRIALQAMREAPLSRMMMATLMRTLPHGERMAWVRHHAALE